MKNSFIDKSHGHIYIKKWNQTRIAVNMKVRRLQKFVLSFGIILSLFVSAFAACACSHHVSAKAEDHAPSCHQTSHENEQSKVDETETENRFPAVSENCNCFVKTSQPFVIGKSENVKIQKVSAVLPVQIKTENYKLISKTETAKVHFEYHFYNSNYLKKLTPPRAPPVL